MIRCKITPRFENDGVHITVDWVEVGEGEVILKTLATEEFRIKAARDGCAYVTRGTFDSGTMLPGTFWMDEDGHRHFVMDAEPGHVGLLGGPLTGIIGG